MLWLQRAKQTQHKLNYEVKRTQSDSLTDVSKYNAILSRSHLDICLDVSKIVRSQSERRRLLNQLEITCRMDTFSEMFQSAL